MNSNPTISVVMSCYNAVSYLDESIMSVLSQTFDDFEFILINDGSCDDTWGIIQGYAATDKRILAINKKNSGLTDSLNFGISRSRGTWIARLDADDVALPTRFEEQMSFLQRAPEIVLLGTDFIEINDSGRVIKQQHYPRTHGGLLRNLRNLGRFFPHSSVMYSREIAGKLGGYNPRVMYAQDWDLWLRFSETGRIACLNKPLVKIRKHGEQISHSDSGRTQAVYGMAATVCYFLRSLGEGDPSTDHHTFEWEAFLEWLSMRLEQEGYFVRLQGWAAARKSFFNGNKMLAVPRLLKDRRSWKYIYKHLEQYLYGTKLPMELADEWSGRH